VAVPTTIEPRPSSAITTSPTLPFRELTPAPAGPVIDTPSTYRVLRERVLSVRLPADIVYIEVIF
jgi:hypothetical protein